MANLTSPTLAVAGLYAALLGRAPDAGGFTFWHQATSNGASIRQLAETFLDTPEGLATFPAGQTNEQFVSRFYTSVFGRAPDAEGLAFWTTALAAQGDSSSLAARATLVLQILDVVSTQLIAKPADVNDAAYLQTIADRARFANQAEFGVYFATELKSDNVNLAKSALALITDNPATLATARQFAANGGISPAPTPAPAPEPSLALTRADSVADIATKFAAYPGTAATVDATGMSAAQLAAVAAGNAKIAKTGIAKLTLPLGDALIVDTVASALLTKTSAAKVDVSGAGAARLKVLADTLDTLADGGITGTLGLNNDLSAAQLSSLLGVKTGAATRVQVDARGMGTDKLATVAAAIDKVIDITGAALTLADAAITDTVALTMLSKSDQATVVASGATPVELSAMAAHISHIARDGITGNLTLTSAQTAVELAALLSEKTASAAQVEVDANRMSSAQLAAVGDSASRVDTLINLTGLALSDTEITDTVTRNLLEKGRNITVVASGASPTENFWLARHTTNIADEGLSGTLSLSYASLGLDTNLSVLLSKYVGTTANVDATDMNHTYRSIIVDKLTKISNDGITGTLVLNRAENAEQLAALLSPKTADAANVQVDATGMDIAQLVAVAAGQAKVDTVSNLSALMLGHADITDTVTTALLAKANAATVVATGASTAELAALITYSVRIATGGITGNVALNHMWTDADLTVLLGTMMAPSANVQIDATGMSNAQLAAVGMSASRVDGINNLASLVLNDPLITDAVTSGLLSVANGATVVTTGATASEIASVSANLGKIAAGGISGTLPLTSGIDAPQINSLFEKYVDTAATVNASGMSGTQIMSIVGNLVKVATDGITGTLVINRFPSSQQITDLLGVRTAAAADVEIDASGMEMTQLNAVLTGIAKVDRITNLTLNLNTWSDANATALLSKASGASVQTGGASTAQFDAWSTYIANIADGGLSGPLSMTDIQLAAMTSSTLNAKLSGTPALSVTGGSDNSVINVSGLSRPVTVRGGAGADIITLGSGSDTVIIGSTAETRSAAFSVNDTTTDNIDRIIGMVNGETLQFAKTPNAFGNGITFTSGFDNSVANSTTFLDLNLGVGSFQTIYDGVNAELDRRDFHHPSTNSKLSIYKVHVASQSGLSGTFLILNDHNALVDGNDLIISLAGMARNDRPDYILG